MNPPLDLTYAQNQQLADGAHTLDEWRKKLSSVARGESDSQWGIADCMLEGLGKFTRSQVFATAKAATGYDAISLRQYIRMAQKFPENPTPGKCTRVPLLTYGHHRAVESETLSPEDRASYLQKAVDDSLSTRQLTALVKLSAHQANAELPIPEDTFRVLYVDPPWKYGPRLPFNYGPAERHYPTLSIKDICDMQIPTMADNSVLFLWATVPMLREAFKVIDEWGFE